MGSRLRRKRAPRSQSSGCARRMNLAMAISKSSPTSEAASSKRHSDVAVARTQRKHTVPSGVRSRMTPSGRRIQLDKITSRPDMPRLIDVLRERMRNPDDQITRRVLRLFLRTGWSEFRELRWPVGCTPADLPVWDSGLHRGWIQERYLAARVVRPMWLHDRKRGTDAPIHNRHDQLNLHRRGDRAGMSPLV